MKDEKEKRGNVLITGVSTGIGYATATCLAHKGFCVFGSVRKQSDADRIKAELGDRFVPLLFDVTDAKGLEMAVDQVKAMAGGTGLKALVNNAGISVFGPLMHLSPETFRQQLEINVVGAFCVTQAFLPLLKADNRSTGSPGRIVNISSISGKIALPFLGAYAASKFALEAMSDALRRELTLYGIDVILIEPGVTATPIINKVKKQFSRFQRTDYSAILASHASKSEDRQKSEIPVEVVSRTIHKAITSKSPKVRYPLPNKWISGWYLPRFLPARVVDRLVSKIFGIAKNRRPGIVQ
jgi:NAD(P)-dependent dehydrogenase (short-subunit alcohol dehydrogenase family)